MKLLNFVSEHFKMKDYFFFKWHFYKGEETFSTLSLD